MAFPIPEGAKPAQTGIGFQPDSLFEFSPLSSPEQAMARLLFCECALHEVLELNAGEA